MSRFLFIYVLFRAFRLRLVKLSAKPFFGLTYSTQSN